MEDADISPLLVEGLQEAPLARWLAGRVREVESALRAVPSIAIFVGSERQIRVFDVQYIKGLEFEAVFFVGVDGLAARVPDLFDKFLFVGSTRAATYLGITCARTLPPALEPLRSHFSAETWTSG